MPTHIGHRLKGMSDERQNRPILSADADKIAQFCRQIIGQFLHDTRKIICRVSCKNSTISSIEHVLCLTILSADFLYIGQQILFMLPW